MIISQFNKYVQKHGRVTYIVLGIIICFAFVIFVTPDNSASGCSGRGRLTSVGKMYGKRIRVEEFQKMRQQTDLACYLRYNMFLSQYNELYLNRETLNRMRMIHEAKARGFLKKVTDQQVAEKIQTLPWLQKDGKFSLEAFNGFKNNFLRANGLSARDFDDLIRQDIAIENMLNDVTKDVAVTDAEIDAELAEYALQYADISLDREKATAPGEQEIKDFWANRKSEIKPDALRSALAISYSLASFPVTVTDAEAKAHFEANKARLYKDKKFEAVKSQIVTSLKSNKARKAARAAADALLEKIQKATEGKTGEEAITKAVEQAKAAKATIQTTGFFAAGNKIPGMDGEHIQLANAVRSLNNIGQVYRSVFVDDQSYMIAALADMKDGELPKELDEAMTAKITDALVAEKALAFYNEQIAPFKANVAATKSVWDLRGKFIDDLIADTKLSEEEKEARMNEYGDFLRECVNPFYRAEERAFSVAAINPADFEKGIVISEGDLKKGFEARKAEYEKVEVRLNQIKILLTKDDKDDVKAAKKAKADAAYAKVLAGEDFAKLVTEYSEDENTKSKGGDTGLVNINSLVPAVKDQVAKMAVNQLSPIISTDTGYVIFKLAEKTSPKTLADVSKELEGILRKEAAKKAAMDEANKLAASAAEAWNASGHKAEDKAALLKSAAQGTKAVVTDVPQTVQTNYAAQGAARDHALMAAVFAATPEEPFTKAVDGTDAAYVACLTSQVLPFIAEAKDVLPTLKNVYSRKVAMDYARKQAEEAVAKINASLKEGTELAKAAGDIAFQACTAKLSKKTIRNFQEFMVRDPMTMLDELAKAADKTVIPAQKGYSGYSLVYVESRTVPAGEEAKADRDAAREQLLGQKKNKVLSAFLQKVEKDSNTKDLHPELTGERRAN